MHQALELASRATMATSPNPKVGCVLVKDGVILGQGWTQPVGQAHAEVMALRNAAAQGKAVRGATAYVSLEPCSHFGRTPPCANALIDAGLARVVAALGDANPQVAGRGFAMLRDAGIVVEYGLLAEQAREINIGFFKRMETGWPWVRVKMAASLDGFTALPNGQSQWITDAAAREDGHRWRARADAILTGIGTVLVDDPQLTVRLPDDDAVQGNAVQAHQPRKLIVDSQLRTPIDAKLFQSGRTTIFHALNNSEREKALQNIGAELQCFANELPAANSQVNLSEVMNYLGREQVNELHVEAGSKLSGALLQAGCVDELLLYFAPKLLGRGASMFALPELQKIAEAQSLKIHDLRQVGEAIRVLARFK
ncbi:bifunctional diaminohydroxyphosphoribosylaminopyrimidine deaminase/5-amino-6-(5-phosphoribosylamino)uracil reductase RibD [Undibacterium sp. LX15W]|uniref:Riboflavin biosynthesis protein RibD n=2 Tax=Undibacterium flavidum TaxID=2762297 RepID=A0ABR6Y8M5_9BURK|nr:bifunctional diaminohydroxyphosphoribosylaminopyrimidine deaminase/5-amino-6-(5-phosphoribosylamino)uracil reductase RibD [Undibacterium flavidum]